ncbi:MAG: prolyl oligopeptidase family serine peptidase, partial [Acidimicrobiales bacterium]
VMAGPRRDDPAGWDEASPLAHVDRSAPPFMIIQGTHDVLVWREETRHFAEQLRAVGAAPVVHWEVPGAQHAFELWNSERSAAAVDAVERFLGWVVGPGSGPRPSAPAAAGETEQR